MSFFKKIWYTASPRQTPACITCTEFRHLIYCTCGKVDYYGRAVLSYCCRCWPVLWTMEEQEHHQGLHSCTCEQSHTHLWTHCTIIFHFLRNKCIFYIRGNSKGSVSRSVFLCTHTAQKCHYPYEKIPWYSHGATMVYHGKQWYTMVRCNCTMVQITCTMVDYGIPWYILTVPWHILVQPWFTELVPWCIMIYHGTSLHNQSTIYL